MDKYLGLIAYSIFGGIITFFLLIGIFGIQEINSKLVLILHLILVLLPFLLIFYYKKFIKIFIGFLLFIIIFDIYKLVTLEIPSGNKNLKSVYIGEKRINNFWNLLSEKDWVEFGTTVNKVLGTSDMQNQNLLNNIESAYKDMQTQEIRKNFDSQIGVSLNDLFGIKADFTHYYFYSLANSSHKSLVIFLHGSAGNFEIYPYRFQSLAEKNNVDIAYPSFGCGNRSETGGVETINKVIDDIQKKYDYQDKSLTLIALSNGGRGLSRFIQQSNYPIKNVFFVSAVMEPSIIQTDSFLDKAKKINNFYIIHGEKDERLSISNVKNMEKILKQNGVNTQSSYISTGTHFVLMDIKDKLINNIGNLLK